MSYEKYHYYLCKINIRDVHNGHKVKKGLKDLIDGKELIFECLWLQDEEDNYPDEYAMRNSEMITLSNSQLGWISSGDLELIEEVKSV